MSNRHRNCWQRFLSQRLHLDDQSSMVSGLCFISHNEIIEYTQGCFQDTKLWIDGIPLEINGQIFTQFFHDYTRKTIKDINMELSQVQESSINISKDNEEDCGFKETQSPSVSICQPSIRIGSNVFHIVNGSHTSYSAVTTGKAYGLIAERLPFGILVITFERPYTLEQVFPQIDRECMILRL